MRQQGSRQAAPAAGLALEAQGSMPQLIFFALIALIAWYGYRTFLREAERVTARVRRAEQEVRTRADGTLVKDPKTGEYRLAKD
jgi:membrane protein implicated in regulation of membrane protease activity